MAPRGRKRKIGLRREDAARDRMREFGFEERVITESIKELVGVYSEDGWKLIEDGGYDALLTICLQRQEERPKHLELAEEQNELVAVEQKEEEVAEEEQEQLAQEEEETKDLVLHEQEQQVEDGRDHVSSSSTSLVGCGADTRTQTCQTDDASITTEVVMDSPPAALESKETSSGFALHSGEGNRVTNSSTQSVEGTQTCQTDDASITTEVVMDSPQPALESKVTLSGFALHSVEGAKNSRGGWLSSEEDTDEDSDSDDDEMIQLTPEPLCEELVELIRKVRGEDTRKRPSRWDR